MIMPRKLHGDHKKGQYLKLLWSRYHQAMIITSGHNWPAEHYYNTRGRQENIRQHKTQHNKVNSTKRRSTTQQRIDTHLRILGQITLATKPPGIDENHDMGRSSPKRAGNEAPHDQTRPHGNEKNDTYKPIKTKIRSRQIGRAQACSQTIKLTSPETREKTKKQISYKTNKTRTHW